jgi:hypothetical protein
MPVKTKLTAMATPDTGHAARANTFFGWGKTTSLLRALQFVRTGGCNAIKVFPDLFFFFDKHTRIKL